MDPDPQKKECGYTALPISKDKLRITDLRTGNLGARNSFLLFSYKNLFISNNNFCPPISHNGLSGMPHFYLKNVVPPYLGPPVRLRVEAGKMDALVTILADDQVLALIRTGAGRLFINVVGSDP